MAPTLDGRHALVTGGSRGIGRAIAAALVQSGARVTVMGRDRASLEAVVGEGDAHGVAVADVTDRDAVRAAMAEASRSVPVDVLVANAGGAESAPFLKTDPALFSRMIDLNLMGVIHTVQAVLPGMLEGGFGRIVAVSSTAGLKGYGYVSAYCAAKHAVVGLVRALAQETAGTGVTVNAVCPGYTETELVTASVTHIAEKTGRSREEALSEILKGKPLGRLIAPEEVAAAVAFLASPGASAMTGQAVAVAGGEI